MSKLIWTPEFSHYNEFRVYLNPTFARKMLRARISDKRQDRMNELANDKLKEFDIDWKNPYTFFEDSALITQIYIGRNGTWLSTNHSSVDLLRSERVDIKPIEYNSHNVDLAIETQTLMRLFGMWVYYSDVLRQKSNIQKQ